MRNAGFVLLQRVADVVRAVCYGALIPRLMGPDDYGRLSVLISVAVYFAILPGLGSAQVMSRFVPGLRLAGNEEGIRRLYGGLLAVRLLTALLSAAACYAVVALWLSDLPLVLAVLMAVGVLLRVPGSLPFALLLGLDRAGRWGMSEVLRRWLSLLLVIPGYLVLGLPGAALAFTLTEVAVLALGFGWTHGWLSRATLRIDRTELAPYLAFSSYYLASNALALAAQQAPAPLVRAVSGEYEQAAYFASAQAAYLVGVGLLGQVLLSLVPWLSALRESGHGARALAVAERMLCGLAVLGAVALLAALLVGEPVVRLVLGAAYLPAVPCLPALALALVSSGAVQVTRVVALIHDRPGLVVESSAVQLAGVLLLGPPLVAALGAPGGALAVLAASALAGAHGLFRLRDVAPGLGRGLLHAVALAALFLPLPLLIGEPLPRALALLGAVLGYAALLQLTGVLGSGDLQRLRGALRHREAAPVAEV